MAIDLKFLKMTEEKKLVPRHALGYAGHEKIQRFALLALLPLHRSSVSVLPLTIKIFGRFEMV